jgi:L-ascorbate metabolism protein UlaG (beta-lactamase superfamily)
MGLAPAEARSTFITDTRTYEAPMQITMIGHSTVLFEIDGMKILSDPYFGTWGNPAYKRLAPPSMTREEIGSVDLVLVSHNHFDHRDRRFLSNLPENVPVAAPAGVTWLTRMHGVRNPQGMRKWEKKRFGAVDVTAVPALHMALTRGFVLEGEGKQIYFAGDTFFRPFMAEIGKRFQLDVALMPVTTFRIPMTMGEKGAARAARDLGASTIIPIHLGLQPRSPLMRTGHSPEGFRKRIQEAGLDTKVVILREGDRWTD